MEDEWQVYRRGLRRRDKEQFDQLWEHARQFADASGLQNAGDPMDAVLLSICLAQERRIAELEDRIDALEDGT
ncbi:MAG: hypothetical protein ABEJ27_06150 [Halodesulfurarchaeum sp.]